MRKTILVLLVLMLAADAMALSVSCTQSGGQTCVVSYNGALPDPNRPRAFAFDVSLSNSKTISSFATSNTDYYIYPGTIDINANDGTVTSWGSPVAGGGNGQTSMIIEMGSLYATNDANHKNAPPAAGTLFTFDVSATTTVTVGKNAARGGVVKENGKSDLADTVCTCVITVVTCTTNDAADKADICGPDFGDPDGQVEYWDYLLLNAYYGTTCSELEDPEKTQCLTADFCSADFGDPDGVVEYWDYLYLNTYYGCPVCQSPPESCP